MLERELSPPGPRYSFSRCDPPSRSCPGCARRHARRERLGAASAHGARAQRVALGRLVRRARPRAAASPSLCPALAARATGRRKRARQASSAVTKGARASTSRSDMLTHARRQRAQRIPLLRRRRHLVDVHHADCAWQSARSSSWTLSDANAWNDWRRGCSSSRVGHWPEPRHAGAALGVPTDAGPAMSTDRGGALARDFAAGAGAAHVWLLAGPCSCSTSRKLLDSALPFLPVIPRSSSVPARRATERGCAPARGRRRRTASVCRAARRAVAGQVTAAGGRRAWASRVAAAGASCRLRVRP